MARLYTRSGDDGRTALIGGRRLRKDDARVEAYGAVDELSAAIGLARAACGDGELAALLARLQHELFELGAELADPSVRAEPGAPGHPPRITPQHVERLEREIDAFTALLPPLQRFILPGGVELGARLHLARAVARRVERRVVQLAGREPVNPQLVCYLNRLSDWLFAAARLANLRAGVPETPWKPAGP
jgi:cob(I)alamin adenosyltransferase